MNEHRLTTWELALVNCHHPERAWGLIRATCHLYERTIPQWDEIGLRERVSLVCAWEQSPLDDFLALVIRRLVRRVA